jgi:hypothetical protein
MLRRILIAGAMLAGLTAGAAQAQVPGAGPASAPAAVPAMTHNDYTDPATWLCRPGRDDACTVNLDATVITADGRMSKESFKADPNAPVDCFYVYPTVSNAPGANSPMAITADERNVVMAQFARLGSKCRLYAPMYRQVTLTALKANMMGRPMPADRVMAYQDVVDAWNEYLAHDNHGRGVVLVGHSQGSGVLIQLIAREIDGKPAQKQIISAILMGSRVQVPRGADVGGSFKTVPLCHSDSQIGCVIAYADFRADSPPPADSLFGKGEGANVAACVNPAALGGGSGAANAYMNVSQSPSGSASGWTNPPAPVTTPFVKLPGLLTAECVFGGFDYLAVTLHPTPGSVRVNDIGGDVKVGPMILKNWGLHLVDANLYMGNLVHIVGEESKAYMAKGH